MRTILLLFDSLNRHALSCYGGSVPTPGFDRLAARTTVFDKHFVGSMPCMPARRDLLTGRLNFLHRSWGPLEPFDISVTGLMAEAGIHSHLATDHYHYFENGGATYHTAYTTWNFLRGQEADPWATDVAPDVSALAARYHREQVETDRSGYRFQGMLNRERIREDGVFPCVRTFDVGLDFIDRNKTADNWFLQLETFDPHEPFFAPEEYRALFDTGYNGPILDWPRYRETGDDTDAEIAEKRANYAALVALCDAQLGRLLDRMDAERMWDDTALIVTTDHGFLLGEHDWWGKNRMPFYNEIAHIPLFLHVPERTGPGRSDALSQNIDVMATLLDIFGLAAPEHVQGQSLLTSLERGRGRALALYGVFGGAINATDGRYTYFHYPGRMEEAPLYEYTLMPQHATAPFRPDEIQGAELHPGFGFTQGTPLLKLRALPDAKRPPTQGGGFAETRSVLYDIETDPRQTRPLDAPEVRSGLLRATVDAMRACEAPPELFDRFELGAPA